MCMLAFDTLDLLGRSRRRPPRATRKDRMSDLHLLSLAALDLHNDVIEKE
jgi:hypothetical protein